LYKALLTGKLSYDDFFKINKIFEHSFSLSLFYSFEDILNSEYSFNLNMPKEEDF